MAQNKKLLIMYLNSRNKKRRILTQIRMLTLSQLDGAKQEKSEKRAQSLKTLLYNLSYASGSYENPCSRLRVGALFKLTPEGKTSEWLFLLPWDLDFPCQVKCDPIGIVEVISTADERFKFLSEKKAGEESEMGKIEEIHWIQWNILILRPPRIKRSWLFF